MCSSIARVFFFRFSIECSFVVDVFVFFRSILFVWGALITLHVRVRIKSNGYA